MTDTKTKILDAAERLFSQQGYSGTSIRQIISEAGVNLAAIHYHFGTKSALVNQIFARKIVLVNQERLQLLDRLEAAIRNGPLPVEKVLEALLLPVFMASKRNPDFIKLIGRFHGEGLIPRIALRHFEVIASRFYAAFERALPMLSAQERIMRIYCAIGATAQILLVFPDELQKIVCAPSERIARQLIVFLNAGFGAPSSINEPS